MSANVASESETVVTFDHANGNAFDHASANAFDLDAMYFPVSDLMESAVAAADKIRAESRLVGIRALQVGNLEVERQVGNPRKMGDQKLKRVCDN